jgi:hypothetical protein
MRLSESLTQEMVFRRLDLILPKYGRQAFAIPNGAKLSGGARAWQKLKREGCRDGLPDFQIPGTTPCGRYGGVAIELKALVRPAATTPAQWRWLLYYASIGWLAARCRGLDEAMRIIRSVGYG